MFKIMAVKRNKGFSVVFEGTYEECLEKLKVMLGPCVIIHKEER